MVKIEPPKMRMKIIISLPERFLDQIKTAINDEIRTAQKKWGVSLTLVEKELVMKKSIEQLQYKMNTVFGNEWDLGDVVEVNVNSYRREEIYLPAEVMEYRDLRLVRQGPRWHVEHDGLKSKEIVPVPEFAEFIANLMKDWSQTAAFYGVGSF